jgi:hypothetical protein
MLRLYNDPDRKAPWRVTSRISDIVEALKTPPGSLKLPGGRSKPTPILDLALIFYQTQIPGS